MFPIEVRGAEFSAYHGFTRAKILFFSQFSPILMPKKNEINMFLQKNARTSRIFPRTAPPLSPSSSLLAGKDRRENKQGDGRKTLKKYRNFAF